MAVEELKARLLAIDWFSRVGDDSSLPENMGRVGLQDIANLHRDWRDLVEKLQGDLHVHLMKKRVLAPQEWNKAVRPIREFVREEVSPKIVARISELNLPDGKVLGVIEWNLMAALLEEHFSTHKPPRNFEHLVLLYEQGHLPCGWQGEWPDGRFLLFCDSKNGQQGASMR